MRTNISVKNRSDCGRGRRGRLRAADRGRSGGRANVQAVRASAAQWCGAAGQSSPSVAHQSAGAHTRTETHTHAIQTQLLTKCVNVICGCGPCVRPCVYRAGTTPHWSSLPAPSCLLVGAGVGGVKYQPDVSFPSKTCLNVLPSVRALQSSTRLPLESSGVLTAHCTQLNVVAMFPRPSPYVPLDLSSCCSARYYNVFRQDLCSGFVYSGKLIVTRHCSGGSHISP